MRAIPLVLGTLLLALGIFGLLAGGFAFSHSKNVVDTNSTHISRETTTHIPLGPAISAVAVVAGGGLVFLGLRQR